MGMLLRGAAFWDSTETLLLLSLFGWTVYHLSFPALHCQSQQHPELGRGAATTAEGPKHCCSLFFTAPLHDPGAGRVRRVGLSEEGSALLFWKVARCRGHPAVTAVSIHTSAFPHSWGEWPSLAVTVSDFSLLQSPTVTVRLQISQGGLSWVLLLFWQHLLFSSLNAASVPACPLCTLLSCPIHFMQRRKKRNRG